MDPLVHGDGQPGGLIEVGVDVSQVGGVVVLNMRRLTCHTVGRGGGTNLVRQSGVTYLALPVVTSGLDAVLHLVPHTAGHLLRCDGHPGVADHVLEGRHTAESLVQVISPVLQPLIARAAFVKIILEFSLTSPEEVG